MISYNDIDKAWSQRIHKEIWTKGELKDFGLYCNGDNVRSKFGVKKPEMQEEIEVTKQSR